MGPLWPWRIVNSLSVHTRKLLHVEAPRSLSIPVALLRVAFPLIKGEARAFGVQRPRWHNVIVGMHDNNGQCES